MTERIHSDVLVQWPTEVAVGQVWADNDPRERKRDRRIVITAISRPYAVARNVETGRRTQVRLTRFRPRYFRYVGTAG